mmetsp:Transcript_23654/g.28542  ORF Transcript_23654/g.28542 Transcript_23654/m.28542 type:complete len:158 (-) Transcript_23654:292-765(-)|eukprot:CAMPEP_0197866642 /NCGR_PEP_ID=MMETSP1438-20131217/44326_1 /TAXON_ID=1461541 /ORGANISM="Pterosperma sp., Strain CCMP1384" /LENGTH=157 /DNA_ID=CAMNT_0043485227 /DNA_START=231 /DNA_END=704 /DNA_ORIENTATION=+
MDDPTVDDDYFTQHVAETVLRQRKREAQVYLQQLREDSSGISPQNAKVLEGVYEMERKPSARTESRLAAQLGVHPKAVQLWFRHRRVKDKRTQKRYAGFFVLGVLLFFLMFFFAEFGEKYKNLFYTAKKRIRPYKLLPQGLRVRKADKQSGASPKIF